MRARVIVNSALRITATGLLLCAGYGAPAEAPSGAESGAANPSASEAQSIAPTGNFLSSLKQGFAQDSEREVVRGHFDVALPAGAQRYYCLIDPKTGKSEVNGVSGQPVSRPDGTTAIKGAAVTLYRCTDAEQRGMLVTTGYVVSRNASRKTTPPAPGPMSVAAPANRASAATPGRAAVLAVYTRFIAAQNAHDRAAVAELLLDSQDFVWGQIGGNSVWGHQAALDAFERAWQGVWRLDSQPQEPRIAEVAPGVAVLIAPLLLTEGSPAMSPPAVSIRWGGVFVKTGSGWRISSIFMTPLESSRAANGSSVGG